MEQILSNKLFWFIISIIPFAFLTYTLLNLKKLKIGIIHGRVLVEFFIFLSFLVIGFSLKQKQDKSFFERIQPIDKKSGFKMDGYWIWGGSVIKVGDEYNMFASRWPKDTLFPYDYREKSEIVRATSKKLIGPYEFQEVIIGERDSSFWDSNMAHNPTIHKIGDKFVLFYIGSDFTTTHKNDRLLRRIGYAEADDINGPWKRSDEPIILEESNNPAIYVEKDNSVKLVFRDEELKVKIAEASTFDGKYTVVNSNMWPECKIEDFYMFKKNDQYHIICEDNVAKVSGHERWGVHLVSDDGINNWERFNPVVVYDHEIKYKDGTLLNCVRRERPQLYINKGKVKALLTGVYSGEESWCQVVEIKPGY